MFAEYAPNRSLHHWITEGRIYRGPDAALRILDAAIQLAWGLDYAHQQHLVHQDVKPANVMIDLSGDDFAVKVTDFGLARARSSRRLLVAGSEIGMVSTGGLTPPTPRRNNLRTAADRAHRCIQLCRFTS